MIRVIAYFDDPSSADRLIELKGLSKRINAIGLQPIPGDQFSFDYLSKEDQEKIESLNLGAVTNLRVTYRLFKFETAYPAIYIKLQAGTN